MTSPPDPRRSGQPDDDTVVVPTGYPVRPPGVSGPGTHALPGPDDYRNPGYHDQPTTDFAYNPYGRQPYPDLSQFPAAFPTEVPPPRRPGYLYLALIFFILSTVLPFLGAFALLTGAASLDAMVPADQLSQVEAVTGVDLVSFVYGVGIGLTVIALLYLLLGIFAVAGGKAARIFTTIMTVLFVLVTAFVLVVASIAGGLVGASGSTVPDLGGPELVIATAIVAAPAALGLLGTIALFLPAANRFYARR